MILVLTACSSGSCRKPLRTYPKPVESNGDSKKENESKTQLNSTVWVYKYDGSLQCQPGTGKSVLDMKSELAGVEVLAQEKRRDGLMHIQACGAKTGQANVYKIRAQDQARAKEKGFQLWEFN